jgi:hypothetical protein
MRLEIEASKSGWLRPTVGAALILHALAHAAALVNAGIRIAEGNGAATAEQAHSYLRFASLLAALAIFALLAGGLGALHVRVFARRWRGLAISGLFTSLLFLLVFRPAHMLVGVAIGSGLFLLLRTAVRHEWLDAHAPARDRLTWKRLVLRSIWVTALAGLAAAIASRPVFLRWGTLAREAYIDLPGDVLPPGKGFQILHATNITATPDQVWPWLAQIGHDRGGFYSYSWLENLFGLNIVNADRVVPAWQARAIGEVVPATPANWLGLIDEPLGWRVTQFEPGRVLFLENWGAFALVKVGPNTTRLYIRTQGAAGGAASLWWSPVELFVFEPVHFVMQRKMMLGIKQRAEQSAREQRRLRPSGPAQLEP